MVLCLMEKLREGYKCDQLLFKHKIFWTHEKVRAWKSLIFSESLFSIFSFGTFDSMVANNSYIKPIIVFNWLSFLIVSIKVALKCPPIYIVCILHFSKTCFHTVINIMNKPRKANSLIEHTMERK